MGKKKQEEENKVLEKTEITETSKEEIGTNDSIKRDDADIVKEKPEKRLFRSVSEEVRSLINEMANDGSVHSKKEIETYVSQKVSQTYTDAVMINVLRNMVQSGSLISVARGSYITGSGCLRDRICRQLQSMKGMLNKVSIINVSNMAEDDFETVRKIKKLEECLDNTIVDLQSVGEVK